MFFFKNIKFAEVTTKKNDFLLLQFSPDRFHLLVT